MKAGRVSAKREANYMRACEPRTDAATFGGRRGQRPGGPLLQGFPVYAAGWADTAAVVREVAWPGACRASSTPVTIITT